MKPVSPVIPGLESYEIVLAKDQPQYMPLPTLVVEGDETRMISRWEFTEDERRHISAGGTLTLEQLTFGQPYHPVAVSIMSKEEYDRHVRNSSDKPDDSCLCNGVGCNRCCSRT